MLEYGDTPAAFAGLDGTEKSRGPRRQEPSVEFAHSRTSLNLIRKRPLQSFRRQTLKVKLCTVETEKIASDHQRARMRRDGAAPLSKTFRSRLEGIASA